MDKELIIQSSAEEVKIALLQDRELLELNTEKSDSNYAVGDIYLGRVKRTMPGLNAAFVDIGYEKDAFLHYLDLGPQVKSLLKYAKIHKNQKDQTSDLKGFKLESDISKSGKIGDLLKKNQYIAVQVVKEPISSKGPRVSSDISLAGRYVVMVPFTNVVTISKRVNTTAEKKRLVNLVESIKPANFGVIIRTAAEEKGVAEIHKDILDLKAKWDKFTAALHDATPRDKVLGEINRTSSIIRDLLNDDFTKITIDNEALYDEIRNYIKEIAPTKEKIVRRYENSTPIFDALGINKQIKGLFGKTVNLPNGSYLVIEHTEALHVIDVNSGNRANIAGSQEENAFKVNMDAAKEIVRQLRLRDMGGIIVIDFIDMRSADNKKKLFNILKEEMASERAKHTILPPTKFGLVQITRQRVRPEMNIITAEVCPACEGSGKIKASILLVDEIATNLDYIIKNQNQKEITLFVHPYVEAYLKKGMPSVQWKWFFKYKKWVKLKSNPNFTMTEYRFFKSLDEEITI
ncbi:MAG: ribonuclease G [Sphingobacteriales bacterium]